VVVAAAQYGKWLFASEAGPTNTEQHPREKDCFLHAEPIVEKPLGKSARDKTSARTWRRLVIALE
jgi:hypothetical protein